MRVFFDNVMIETFLGVGSGELGILFVCDPIIL
jgi:hypothetical protein